jgi:hypothetical protein
MPRPRIHTSAFLVLVGTVLATFHPPSCISATDPDIFPFVLPWDDASPGVTNISSWLEAPAGKNGFVTVKDGHLQANGKRLRFWGTNLCFGANFPAHADAEKIAARMAKLGLNCVRFHHMDMFAAPGGLLQKDMKTLDPGQLDKLDYFIAELKKHGIYTNLNLHVSRTYPDRPTWDGAPSFFKGVDLFDPGMIAQQKDYARALLTHVNPYTKSAYVDEPAVALVEINNENGLILEWWGGSFDKENVPAVYQVEFQRRWNEWLRKKYKDTEALKAAWGQGAEELGAELLKPEAKAGTEAGKLNPWLLEQHAGAKAHATATAEGIHIQIVQPGAEAWHVQYGQSGLSYQNGKAYTLKFRAKADKTRNISVNAGQARDPWKDFWSTEVSLSPEWKEFSLIFPAEAESQARLVFSSLGAQTGEVWIGGVSLRPGGTVGFKPGEDLGSIPFFKRATWGERTKTARTDWMTFLWDTEESYWTGFRDFLKNDLKAKSLIVGSAVGFSPSPIQATLDVVDSHSYWHHPHFPGKSWDRENWIVKNEPMSGIASGGTLPGLALRRVAGKPFICTEYNASAPNTYNAETFPLIAAYGALQDWDGIFSFAYSHRSGNDWNPGFFGGFFDIDQHPVKLATLPAAAALFLRGDVAAAKQSLLITMTRSQGINASLKSGPWWDLTSFGLPKLSPFSHRTEMSIGHESGTNTSLRIDSEGSAIPSDTQELLWDTPNRRVTINTPRSKAFVGKAGTAELGSVKIEILSSRQEWAAVTLTCLDGKDFSSPGRILVTAAGLAENTGMQWKNAEKNSVGKDWGRAPSRVEGIGAQITLPLPPSRLKIRALDERGLPTGEIPVKPAPNGKSSILEIGPGFQTLWYQAEVSHY